MSTRRAAAVAWPAAVTVILTAAVAGCAPGDGGTADDAPKASPTAAAPFTKETVANEVGAAADASGLPPGDDSLAGTPEGQWRDCVAPWLADAPAAAAAEGFTATVERLEKLGWKVTTSREEQDVTLRTLTKQGWKVYARHFAMDGFGAEQPVSFTAVKDGCALPEEVQGDFGDDAA